MLAISLFSLILFLFPIRVSCRTKFLRPPEWDWYVDVKAGLEENIGYQVGDTIQLLWETDLDKVELFLVQEIGSITVHRVLDSSRTEWKAEWDVNGLVKGNEDSLYWFALKDPGDLEVSIAQTQYFNVTAPELETHTTLQTSTATQSTTSKIVGVATTQLIPIPTVTDQYSNESNSDAGSDSGMSKGEITGAAVGGTIGGLILLGAVGWLIWRRLAQIKKDTEVSVVTQSQQQQFHSSETKAELPGDPAVEVYPSGYARSPPGLHEALMHR